MHKAFGLKKAFLSFLDCTDFHTPKDLFPIGSIEAFICACIYIFFFFVWFLNLAYIFFSFSIIYINLYSFIFILLFLFYICLNKLS